MDWMEQEQERGITITSAATSASGRATRSTSSTRPATSTSPSRSSVRCACSTARSRSSTLSPASSRRPKRVASGRQVQRAAHVLRQQAGPHRRGLLPLRRDDDRPAQRDPAGAADPDRARERPIGVVDLLGMRALTWRGRPRRARTTRSRRSRRIWPSQAEEWRVKLPRNRSPKPTMLSWVRS